MTLVEDALHDFIAVQRLAGLTQDTGNDVSDGAAGVTPRFESVNTAADQDETLVFDEFVVDGLDGDVFAFEVTGKKWRIGCRY